MPAVDSNGNIHVVWVDNRTGNDEIFYTMLSPAGVTLIDDTQLTSDFSNSKRPAIAIDSQNDVQVVWQDQRLGITETFHTKIDPALDDQDGSPADPTAVTLVEDQLLSSDDGVRSNHPRLAVDSRDRVHVVWSGEFVGEVHYARLNSDGTVAVPDRIIFSGGLEGFRILPTVAVDSNDNVHIAWSERRGTSDAEIFYAMLGGDTGATLIDSTVLTPDDGFRGRFPSVGIGPGDEVIVVFQDLLFQAIGGQTEIFMLRIDPGLDDQDGDAADLNQIRVLADTPITPNDGTKSNHPTATVDGQGNVRVTYYDNWSGFDRGDLFFRLVDPNGVSLFPGQALTEGRTAVATTGFTLGFAAVDGPTSHVTWTDDAAGSPQVLLRILNPDTDRDGLSNGQERQLGTDPNNPDTDGGGRTDGEEVLIDGTDPLDPGDDASSP